MSSAPPDTTGPSGESKPADSPIEIYRHSSAHLLAAAVTELFPDTQCGIGPPTDDGFFYDFLTSKPFTPEDLTAIEKKMAHIVKQNRPIEKKLIPKAEALQLFAEKGQSLKCQLIEEKAGDIVQCYTMGPFMDFCLGPHLPSTSHIKAFKLNPSPAAAYWKGKPENPSMQRIYGYSFFTKEELDQHLFRLAEAKKRDHRKLGKELGLYMTHAWAPGAPFWMPKGTILWNVLAEYMRDVVKSAGFTEVRSPLVFNQKLWETSGHWFHYRENMFEIHSGDEVMGMKAMNCPGHMLMFGAEKHSYRELPIRFHDQSVLHRNEASGVLSGLTRVRQFSQDDGHIFITPEQIASEIESALRLVQRVYKDFGLTIDVKLSTRPPEFLGEIATWDDAEAQLKMALEAAGQKYEVKAGDGAFYGPKIDFDVTDALGRKWQCATIQLDYQLPQRFDLWYTGPDGADHRPIVVHRAIFGSFERFIALLIENYAGAFPVWLAPVQAVVIPVVEAHNEYARKVAAELGAFRIKVDERNETLGYKIREAQAQKVPYMLVVGDKEAAEGTVAVRHRFKADLGAVKVSDFAAKLSELIATHNVNEEPA
ncbi:MAG: threonine--tRNA ligase [Vicinamibacteria bacterium]